MSTAYLAFPSPIKHVSKHSYVPQDTTTIKITFTLRSVVSKSRTDLSMKFEGNSCFGKIPLPDQMAFNDTQTAYWIKHTPPRVSEKIKKLVDLRKIAYDQERAGIRFEGRRSAAEAEVALLQERLVQSSQAVRIQNPLTFALDSINNLKDGITYFFQGTPSVGNVVDQFSESIGNTKYKARKSTSLSNRDAAGESVSTFGVLLVDTGHTSIDVQNGIKIFLEKHFKPERGDIFLTEAVFVNAITDGEEKVVRATVEEHHKIFCMGVPLQSCQFFREPEKEIAQVIPVMIERRSLINKMFEFLMSAIPPSKALEARRKLENRNNEITTADTEFKLSLMIEYESFCYPAMQQRWTRRFDPLIKITAKEKQVQAATAAARDITYFEQLTQAMKQLKSGARLFYTMGVDHCEQLEGKINTTDTFIVDIDISNSKDEL